jgi:GMP synthase-like glutamine amidotransferase
MRVLAIRHHVEDNPGLIGEALEERGAEVDLVMLDSEQATPSLDGYDMVLILGSKESVYDSEVEAAWFGRELSLMHEADQRGLPIFGICFGAQALCRLFGGTVTRSNEPEVGWYDVEAVNGAEIADGPWFEFHYDSCELPEQAQLWARSPRAVQAFAIDRHVGVQFHPEIDDQQLRDWLETASGEARDFGHDPDELVAFTAAQVPAARLRALALVDTVLRHNGLAQA